MPPPRPPSRIWPLNVVDVSRLPTVSVLWPRKMLPPPAIEPAVVPPLGTGEKPGRPPVLTTNARAPAAARTGEVRAAAAVGRDAGAAGGRRIAEVQRRVDVEDLC